MRNDDRSFDENEWTPEEQAHVEALSTHRVPPAELKPRTVRALRDRGYIGPRVVSPWIVVAGLVAATIIFVVGTMVGYAAASRRVTPSTPVTVATARAVAQIDSTEKTPARHVVWY
jgi:hypothetical protein